MEKKIEAYYMNLGNAFNEEKQEYTIEFNSDDQTEDYTAMLLAMHIMYKITTQNQDTDIIDFTHILNKLAVQHVLETEKEE